MNLAGPIRLYVHSSDEVSVVADRSGDGCFHLEPAPKSEKLVWTRRREGSTLTHISLAAFIAWLAQGGLE